MGLLQRSSSYRGPYPPAVCAAHRPAGTTGEIRAEEEPSPTSRTGSGGAGHLASVSQVSMPAQSLLNEFEPPAPWLLQTVGRTPRPCRARSRRARAFPKPFSSVHRWTRPSCSRRLHTAPHTSRCTCRPLYRPREWCARGFVAASRCSQLPAASPEPRQRPLQRPVDSPETAKAPEVGNRRGLRGGHATSARGRRDPYAANTGPAISASSCIAGMACE